MNPADFTRQDAMDIALILLPLAALIFGIGIGIVATKMGYWILYREHLEQHSFAEKGRYDCPFCREERVSLEDVGPLTSNPDGKLQ